MAAAHGRVCLTCCEVGADVAHSAESETHFQVWKANVTTRHTLCHTLVHNRRLKISCRVSFPVDDEEITATREGTQSFSLRLFSCGIFFSFPCFVDRSHQPAVFTAASRFSLSFGISFYRSFHACLKIRVLSQRVGRQGRREGPLPPPPPTRPRRQRTSNSEEALLSKRTVLVWQGRRARRRRRSRSTVFVARKIMGPL